MPLASAAMAAPQAAATAAKIGPAPWRRARARRSPREDSTRLAAVVDHPVGLDRVATRELVGPAVLRDVRREALGLADPGRRPRHRREDRVVERRRQAAPDRRAVRQACPRRSTIACSCSSLARRSDRPQPSCSCRSSGSSPIQQGHSKSQLQASSRVPWNRYPDDAGSVRTAVSAIGLRVPFRPWGRAGVGSESGVSLRPPMGKVKR